MVNQTAPPAAAWLLMFGLGVQAAVEMDRRLLLLLLAALWACLAPCVPCQAKVKPF